MRSNFTRGKLPLVAWAILVLAAVAATVAMTAREDWLESNVFELLPRADYDPLTAAATAQVDRELGTRLLFFVGDSDRGRAASAAAELAAALREHPHVAAVAARADAWGVADAAAFYHRFRRQMLSGAQVAAVLSDPDSVEQHALATLYSPFGSAGIDLESDPFLLYPGSLRALRPAATALEYDRGYLWAHGDGRDYAFVTASLDTTALSIADQDALARHIDATIDNIVRRDPGIDVLRTGFVFYANEATQAAKGEISTIGVGSLIGVLLLVVTTFRSLRPLSLIALSILAGCAFALAVTLAAFGQVHLFTLVFGASLIGVSVDYSFHYVADDAFGGDDWTPRQGVANIFAGITLGLVTSVLAYLALTVAPFPGLQQLAVFSSAGLVGAWLTLLAVCGLWRRRLQLDRASLIFGFARRYLGLWQRSREAWRYGIVAAIAVAIAAGYSTIRIDDDVTALQAQPPELKRQEAEIQDMLGVAQAGTFVLVKGASADEVLESEEAVRKSLDELDAARELSGYQALSRYVPSVSRQRASYDAYTGLVRARLTAYLEALGAGDAAIERTLAALTSEMQPLELAEWLQDPVSAPLRGLWVEADGAQASIVLLYGVQDVARISAELAGHASARVVNKAAEFSDLFGQYRLRVAEVLAAAYLVILVALSLRYGPGRAVLVIVPPIFAGFVALIAIALAGETLNLFNFLAMILVLGIGIDFTLFIAESHGDGVSTMFAITLSALTTMLSFGLLSLSATYAVHSFGLTVLIGIACAYLLSPLALAARKRSK